MSSDGGRGGELTPGEAVLATADMMAAEPAPARRRPLPLPVLFAAGLAFGCAAALGTVRWRRHTGDAARRRLLGAEDVDCVAGAGWGGAKSVDRLGALQHVNHDIPAAIQTGPTKAWLLGHGHWDGHLDATLVPDSCRELDVVVANSAADRCLVVSSAATTAVPHHVTRWERSSTHATGWATISRIRESKQRMPGEVTRK